MTLDKLLALPFKNNGIVKLLIGGVLQLIPIVSLFSLGYILECCENGALRHEEMPEWTDWGNKFVSGFLVAVISFIYTIIPTLLFGASLIRMFSNHGYHMGGSSMFLAAIIFILFTFPLPMALANFAVEKNFGAAFEFGYIFQLISTSLGSYIGAFLLYIVILIAVGIIGALISLIPVIGWICMIFVGFYIGCVCSFLFGSVYGEARRSI
ncbi:DUF4013 domain-containing protein [Pelotomaculum propionicicum]|uniref:DUF4013 domain-containing protein n=1 Tax=Pelotomaculum propionicicum TaxID=258475 RepID=UPI003B80DA83